MTQSHQDQHEAEGPHPATRRIIAMNIESIGELQTFEMLAQSRIKGEDTLVCIMMSAPSSGAGLRNIEEWAHRQIEGKGAIASWLVPWQEEIPGDRNRYGKIARTREELEQIFRKTRERNDEFCILGVQTGIVRMPRSLEEAFEHARTLLDVQQGGISVQCSIRNLPQVFKAPDGQELIGYAESVEIRFHISLPGIIDITHMINQEEHHEATRGWLRRDWGNFENIPGLDTNMPGFGEMNRN